ncbi:MAG: PAS domain S-box protein [Nitrospirales bacterium]
MTVPSNTAKPLHPPSPDVEPWDSHEKWEQAFDALPDHVMILDRSGIILWVNRSIRDQFGETIHPLLGQHYSLLYYGGILPSPPPPWEPVLAGALSAILETSFPTLPGHYLVSCHPLYNRQGTQWGAILVVKDITERKRVEEALKKIAQNDSVPGSIAFLRGLVRDLCSALKTPYALLADWEAPGSPDIKTLAVLANGRYLDNFSWTPPPHLMQELLKVKGCMWSHHAEELFPPHTLPHTWLINGYLGCALRGQAGQIIGILLTFHTEPLTNLHVAQSIVQLFGARAASELQRKKTADALRDSEQRYRAIVENAYDLIIETSPSGECHYVSPNCVDVLGYQPHEMLGKKFFDFLHPEDRPGLIDSYLTNVLSLEKIDLVCRLRNKQLEWRVFESHIRPLRTTEGSVVGVIVTRDITERKRLEEERLRSTKLESVGLLAGGIAHDFNNILTSVFANIGLAKMMASKNVSTALTSVIERLGAAEKACLRARDLTKQLLTFAKGGVPVKSTTSISAIITDTVDFALRGSAVSCVQEVTDDLWPVEADEGQISQVLQNLVINADQAMPEGGTIHLEARNVQVSVQTHLHLKPGRYVQVSVSDQGLGIPPEHLPKIFDPYFTTKQKGSGLGLATTYSILKGHDGHIEVTSTLGKGTKFRFYLPASTVEQAPQPEKREGLFQGTGRMLIMDDEAEILEVLKNMLKEMGLEADAVSDGKRAVELYTKACQEGTPYTATILDLTIPGGMGGKEAFRQIKAMDQKAQVIVSSGYSNDPLMANAAKFGISGIIAKPYNIEDLSHILRKVLKS